MGVLWENPRIFSVFSLGSCCVLPLPYRLGRHTRINTMLDPDRHSRGQNEQIRIKKTAPRPSSLSLASSFVDLDQTFGSVFKSEPTFFSEDTCFKTAMGLK